MIGQSVVVNGGILNFSLFPVVACATVVILTVAVISKIVDIIFKSMLPCSAESSKRSLNHDKIRKLPWSPFLDAAWFRRHRTLKELIKIKEINFQDVDKATALHAAVLRGNLKGARILLDAGANIEAREMRGQTPLHWAARKGDMRMIDFLVSRGADVNACDDRQKTPLRMSAKKGHLMAAASLVAWGANIEALDAKKQTPYFVASLQGHKELANYFRTIGANTNVTNIDGMSASKIAGRASFAAFMRHHS